MILVESSTERISRMSRTILVVDDDPVSIRLLEIILDRGGYEVITARTGRSGLELIPVVQPSVIIIDDMMPEMTGAEMCQQIKTDPVARNTPVILISAGTRVQSPSYVKRAGADYAMLKPILPKDLMDAIATLLRA